eukprot:773791-Lingulodinium_polyedra.AAC.1
MQPLSRHRVPRVGPGWPATGAESQEAGQTAGGDKPVAGRGIALAAASGWRRDEPYQKDGLMATAMGNVQWP